VFRHPVKRRDILRITGIKKEQNGVGGTAVCPKNKGNKFPVINTRKPAKLFAEKSAKKMAGGRGEKPPCRVRLLKRRRYVWAI